jgi:hypothetical protein
VDFPQVLSAQTIARSKLFDGNWGMDPLTWLRGTTLDFDELIDGATIAPFCFWELNTAQRRGPGVLQIRQTRGGCWYAGRHKLVSGGYSFIFISAAVASALVCSSPTFGRFIVEATTALPIRRLNKRDVLTVDPPLACL